MALGTPSCTSFLAPSLIPSTHQTLTVTRTCVWRTHVHYPATSALPAAEVWSGLWLVQRDSLTSNFARAKGQVDHQYNRHGCPARLTIATTTARTFVWRRRTLADRKHHRPGTYLPSLHDFRLRRAAPCCRPGIRFCDKAHPLQVSPPIGMITRRKLRLMALTIMAELCGRQHSAKRAGRPPPAGRRMA